jgi:PAT family beta-lactamase induction signal transducer AmpG
VIYGATGFELFSSGLGTSAFGVLLIRLTAGASRPRKYALFSSLFSLPCVMAWPLTGFLAAAVGWPTFFLTTIVLGLPGLVMLARFVQPGVSEPAALWGDEDDAEGK